MDENSKHTNLWKQLRRLWKRQYHVEKCRRPKIKHMGRNHKRGTRTNVPLQEDEMTVAMFAEQTDLGYRWGREKLDKFGEGR